VFGEYLEEKLLASRFDALITGLTAGQQESCRVQALLKHNSRPADRQTG